MKNNLLFLFFVTILFLFSPLIKNDTSAQTATYNVTGTVYNDLNQNGVQNPGESGYADVRLSLGGTRISTVTDASGNYTFLNVSAGDNKSVVMFPPSGYVETVKNPAIFTLNSNTTQNFGIVAIPTNDLTSIRGYLTSINCPKSNGILCVTIGTDVSQSPFHSHILTTTDGTNWTKVQDIPSSSFGGISCPNNGAVFCVAAGFDLTNGNNKGMIFTTADGINWNKVTNVPDLPNVQFGDSIACPNSNGVLCIAMGNGSQTKVVITSDGDNWINASTPPSGIIYGIDCPKSNGILCVGVGVNGVITTTIDGTNWTNVQNVGITLIAVSCPNSGGIFCMAVSPSGNVLTTGDGINWTEASDLPYEFRNIVCPNIEGILCAAVAGNKLLTTINGEDWTDSSWTSLVVGTPTRYYFGDIACPNTGEIPCLAVGDFQGITTRLAAIAAMTPENTPTSSTFNSSADTYVKSGYDNRNTGAGIFMRLQASGDNRGLVKFDQSELQSTVGSNQVLSAKLQVTITDNGNNWGITGRTIDLHRLTTRWDEGSGTESNRGTGSGATWECAIDSTISNQTKNCSGQTQWEMGQPNNPIVHPWIQTATATQTITNNQSGVVEFDVTGDVVSFLDGTNQNYGWILKKTNEGQNGQVSFGTKESATVPQLVVSYQP